MKLYCLSSNPSKPCLVLHFKSVQIMLDCSLDIAELQHFMPTSVVASSQSLKGFVPINNRSVPSNLASEVKECGGRVFVDGVPEFCVPLMNMIDFSQLDAILISNFTCMMALPFITEYTDFKGLVYATEPTLQLGKQYMEELVTYVERISKSQVATRWKQENALKSLPAPLRDAVHPWLWRKCYTMHDIESSLSKVQLVGFNEKKSIYGSLDVLASSSGFALGSSNWVIQSEYEKVCYIAGSSTLTTHPKPMEQAPLRNSDVLILSCLTQTPLTNPDSMIGEFCLNVALTIKNGGNVLVPCYPSGITFDLFECVSGHMETCGLGQVPMYFLSPVAENTLAYSNIFAEWCSQGKQSKVYLPEPPFPHADLVSNGRLKPFISIHDGLTNDFKQPCIVFAGHPSLRIGDAVHFLELWGKSSGNTIIFTEPDFPYMSAMAPFQPLAMRVCYCPIDTSLNFSQANKLIKELHPLNLVVAESYLSPPILQPHRTELTIDWPNGLKPDLKALAAQKTPQFNYRAPNMKDTIKKKCLQLEAATMEPAPLTYKMGEVVSLPIKRKFERIEITPELAATLEPVEIKPGSAVSMVTAALISRDNKYLLQPVPKEMSSSRKRQADGSLVRPKPFIYGTLNIRQFVSSLAEDGITDVKVEDVGEGHIIHLPSDDTLIQVEPESTHIICEGNQSIRIKLKDTLLQCLSKL